MEASLEKKFKKMSLAELQEVQDAVSDLIVTKQEEEKADLKVKMQEMAKASGMTIEEIFGLSKSSASSSDKRRKSPKPKYQHPDTDQTWSGRGRMPRWLTDIATEKEIDLENTTDKTAFLNAFLIEKPEETDSEDG